MLQPVLQAAVHHAQAVLVERVAAARVVLTVALVAHHAAGHCRDAQKTHAGLERCDAECRAANRPDHLSNMRIVCLLM